MERSAAKDFIFRLKVIAFTALETLQAKPVKSIKVDQTPIIVLLKPLGIGDLIMISPIFSLLSKRYAEVVVVSDYDNFFETDNLRWYSVADFLRQDRTGFYIFPMHCFSNARLMRKKPLPYIGYFLTNKFNGKGAKFDGTKHHYFAKVFDIITFLKLPTGDNFDYPKLRHSDYDIPTNYVCISPFSNWATRTSSPIRFTQFLERSELGAKIIVIIGGSGDDEKRYNAEFADKLTSKGYEVSNLTGATNFQELVSVIKHADIFMGNDSGPSHIASVMGTKTIIFDGCVPASLRVPLNDELKSNISYFDGAFNCPSYPCYNGYMKPSCIAAQKYNCMDAASSVIEGH